MDLSTETCEEEMLRTRKRATKFSLRGALVSTVLAIGVMGGGMLFSISQMPKSPPVNTTYQDATRTLIALESELITRIGELPYKNPAVEQYLKGRASVDGLEAAIATVKTDINKLEANPAFIAYQKDVEKLLKHVLYTGALATGTMLLGVILSERARRRIESGLPPFFGS